MGYVLPEGADAMLDLIGAGWPNVDEDNYRDMATELRNFADDVEEDSHTAHGGVKRLVSSGKLGNARSHQGRTRGRDSLATWSTGRRPGRGLLEKTTKQLGDHLGGKGGPGAAREARSPAEEAGAATAARAPQSAVHLL